MRILYAPSTQSWGTDSNSRRGRAILGYLNAIRSVKPPTQKWQILVVDEHSERLINAVLKKDEILEENIAR